MLKRAIARLVVILVATAFALIGFEAFAHVIPAILPRAIQYELGFVKARVVVDPSGDRMEEAINSFDGVVWHAQLDSHGFRRLGPSDSGGHPFALVLGDSMSFCWGVEASDCWVSQLQRRTGRTFVDFGLPGTGSLSHYDVLEAHLAAAGPKLVIWQFFLNDFHEDWERTRVSPQSPNSGAHRGAAAWLLDGHVFLQGHSAVYALIKFAKNRTAVVAMGGGLQYVLRPAWIYNLTHTYTDLSEPDVAAGFQLSMESLEHARQLTAKYGARFVVVVAPVKERVYWTRIRTLRVWPDGFDPGRADQAILDFCRQHGIASIDLADSLRAAGEVRPDLYFTFDDHWTPAGNDVVANQLYDYLNRRGMLSLNSDSAPGPQ